jgi:hypothetical protein
MGLIGSQCFPRPFILQQKKLKFSQKRKELNDPKIKQFFFNESEIREGSKSSTMKETLDGWYSNSVPDLFTISQVL